MNARRKPAWIPDPQLTSVDLAEIRQRYVGSRLPAQVATDMDALWHECDRLRFALAAADERTRIAREERKDIEERYWRLQMVAVKGGKV